MKRKIGIALLITGILALFSAILLAFAVGGVWVTVLMGLSILINSAGVMLLSGKGK